MRSGCVEHLHQFTMAEDALAFLGGPERPRIDAILLDIRMPRVDGFEFLNTALATLGDVLEECLVILLTTSTSEADRTRAARYGVVQDYFNKPLTQDHLDRIDKMIHDRLAA
ncbi:MAG: response regulator [Pseudomonadota bacterium]